MRIEVLERERKELKLFDLKEYSYFLSGQRPRGGRWGSIYSPHLKRAVGGIFHRTSPMRPPDKSGGPLWKLVESFWKSVPDRTSPMKASGSR
jgi:hypothetical protein